MKESKMYKTYYAFATGKAIPKPKYIHRPTKVKTEQAPKASSGKRIKATAKVARSGKKKQPAKGLETLSKIALSEAEKMKLAIKRSKTQIHSSQPSGSGAHEGTGVKPKVPDVPTYESDDEQISWKSNDEEDDDVVMSDDADDNDDQNDDDTNNEDDDDDQNDDNANNESDDDQNDDDDHVHSELSTFDEKERQDDKDKEEEWSNDEAYDDKNQGANVEREELDEEETNEEDEANELYRDVNVNLEGRDTEMTDAPRTIVQTTQVIEDTHVIITPVNPEGQQQSSSLSSDFVSNMLNPSPDTCIDSIFNLNTESTSLVDVPATTIAETLLSSATTLPPPPIPLISHPQQTPVPTPATVPSSSLQDLPNFGSLFGFFNSGIVDMYLANKMNEAVKTDVQLQSDRLRDEAQAKNEDFINKLDDNIKKIIKEQVKEQVKAQVSKILPKIKKAVNEQLEAEDDHKEPSAGSNWGSKRRRAGKEPESTSAPKEKTSKIIGKSTEGSKSHHKSAQTEEPMHTTEDLEEPVHQEFVIGVTEDQPDEETSHLPNWFQKPPQPPTLDCDWNKTLPAAHGPVQPWLSTLAQKEDTHDSFNELLGVNESDG
ncbi:hypothetical protein Tco_0912408 [Tanacetum coccineum]